MVDSHKVLFHSPNELSDYDRLIIGRQLNSNRRYPFYLSAGLAGLAYLADVRVFKRHLDWKRVIAAGSIGLIVGAT
jgi:hypothetical protein